MDGLIRVRLRWLLTALAVGAMACSSAPEQVASGGAKDGAAAADAADGGGGASADADLAGPDTGSADAGAAVDGGATVDAGVADAGETDSGSGDGGSNDAGSPVKPVPPKITTTIYRTADQMLLANEINESGEPFAEALGYDLDKLDPDVAGKPDATAYVLGIENYEYSRYQLGTVVGRSGIGLHMMWAPVIHKMAAMEPEGFDGSMTGGKANGFNEDDELKKTIKMFATLAKHPPPGNPWPQFAEFRSGDPHLPQKIDAAKFAWADFATLRWDRSKMDKTLNPAAMGQTLMKQYLWAQDMLSAFHDKDDNGIDADGVVTPDKKGSPKFDPDNNVYYGGDSLDGFIGMVLTAEAINKVVFITNKLAYDGGKLGAVALPTYDPQKGLRYFPHGVAVTESVVKKGLPPRATKLSVSDASSHLIDQVSLLWGVSSFVNMMDPTDFSDSAHKAYKSVFDGMPFPAAATKTGDAPGPYNLMKGTARAILLNLKAMHRDSGHHVLVDIAELKAGKVVRGNRVSTLASVYLIVSLETFVKEFAKTPLEALARGMVKDQAQFLIAHLSDGKGGYYGDVTLAAGDDAHGKPTLGSQAAAVRGLYVAARITSDASLSAGADKAYGELLARYRFGSTGLFRNVLAGSNGAQVATYTPRNVALLSGALREAALQGQHKEAAAIYTQFWLRVAEKMQLSEGANTGEKGNDSDKDGIPFIPEQPDGLPPVFATKGEFTLN